MRKRQAEETFSLRGLRDDGFEGFVLFFSSLLFITGRRVCRSLTRNPTLHFPSQRHNVSQLRHPRLFSAERTRGVGMRTFCSEFGYCMIDLKEVGRDGVKSNATALILTQLLFTFVFIVFFFPPSSYQQLDSPQSIMTKPSPRSPLSRLLRAHLLYIQLPVALLTVLLVASPWFQREVIFLHHLKWPLPSSSLQDLTAIFGETDSARFDISNVHASSASGSGSPTLHGYRLLPPSPPPSPLPPLLFFHGNGCSRGASWRVSHVKNLAAAGLTVYAFDVRGYGDVGGAPTKMGVKEDARRIYERVRELEGGGEVFLYGHR